MMRLSSLDRRLAGGFFAMAGFAVLASLVVVLAARYVLPNVATQGSVIQNLSDALSVAESEKRLVANTHVYLITGRDSGRDAAIAARKDLESRLEIAGRRLSDPAARPMMERIEKGLDAYRLVLLPVMALRSEGGSRKLMLELYESQVIPRRLDLDRATEDYLKARANAVIRVHGDAWVGTQNIQRSAWIAALIALVTLGAIFLALRTTLIRLFRAEEERTQAEAAAREVAEELAHARAQNQETSRLILVNALDAILHTDEQGRITYVNPEAVRLFGWPAADIMGLSFATTLLAPEHHAPFLDGMAQFRRAGYAPFFDQRSELEAVRRDGSRFPIELALSAVGRDGVFFSAFVRDITERKQSEVEREKLLGRERVSREEAQHANRMKDEFVATLSHELRTPLQAILGWARVLSSEPPGSDKIARGIEVIERNATVQKRLIEDLLDMNRIVQGKVKLDVQPMDPATVIHSAVEAVRPAIDARSMDLVLTLDPSAGPILGDPARLQQVLWNLLSNAAKFTPPGGRVSIESARRDQVIEIRVSDTGLGIDPDFLPHVFERFRQQDASTTRRHGGLGLGLAIVRTLVEMHGGTVRADSVGVGRGSTFTLEFPLLPGLTPVALPGIFAAAPALVSTRDGSHRTSLADLRILVVDDEQDARELVQSVLASAGAAVVTARSVHEAMKALLDFRPNAVVSDIGMPEADGYELIRQIRMKPDEQGGNVPAIALSAFAASSDREAAMRAGFQRHVQKPIEPEKLVAIVRDLAR